MHSFKIGDLVRFDRTFDANAPTHKHDQDHGGDTVHTVTGTSGSSILYLDGQRLACYWQRVVLAQAPAPVPAAPPSWAQARQAAYDAWSESKKHQVNTQQTCYLAGYDQARKDVMTACYGDAKAHARVGDPETSKQAAASVKVGKLNDRIIAEVRDFGGGTAHAIAKRIGEPLNTVSPRMAKLVRQGWLRTISTVKEEGSTAPRSYYGYGG